MCSSVFAPNLLPHVNWTNDYYGSKDYTASSNILFVSYSTGTPLTFGTKQSRQVNGKQDPWNWVNNSGTFTLIYLLTLADGENKRTCKG